MSRLNQKSPFLKAVSPDQFHQDSEMTAFKVQPFFLDLLPHDAFCDILVTSCEAAETLVFFCHFIDTSLWAILQVSIVL